VGTHIGACRQLCVTVLEPIDAAKSTVSAQKGALATEPKGTYGHHTLSARYSPEELTTFKRIRIERLPKSLSPLPARVRRVPI
jgi:hypothetical protein